MSTPMLGLMGFQGWRSVTRKLDEARGAVDPRRRINEKVLVRQLGAHFIYNAVDACLAEPNDQLAVGRAIVGVHGAAQSVTLNLAPAILIVVPEFTLGEDDPAKTRCE